MANIKYENLLQLKVQLKNYSPSIYRTFLIGENDNFEKFHEYIQYAFGFYDYHLWHFYKRTQNIDELEITFKDEDFEAYFRETKDPKKTKLKDIFITRGLNKLSYEYDFGDGWNFDISCQKIIPNDGKLEFPKIIKMKGGMLIEDCGGVWGLAELVDNYNKKIFDDGLFDTWEDFEEYISPHFEELTIDDLKIG